MEQSISRRSLNTRNSEEPCTSAQAAAIIAKSIKKPRKKPVTRSNRACLLFPVGRIERALRRGKYTERIAAGVPVYLAAVLEYLAIELLNLASSAVLFMKKTRIMPHHLQMAIRSDNNLTRVFAGVPRTEELSSCDCFVYEDEAEGD